MHSGDDPVLAVPGTNDDGTLPTLEAALGGFEIIEHTADVGVIARDETFTQALGWLAKGMFSLFTDLDTVQSRDTLEVAITSTDQEALAVDWLNELLYRYDADRFLPKEFDISANEGGTSLVARCTGERAGPERHGIGTAVKAATYHGLEVSHDGEWRIQVVLDV